MSVTVFTNGCFDLLHPGHVDLLERARALGDRLVVGINSDRSVRSIKGAPRPFMNQDDRKSVLLALASVDEVVVFDETTPENLIKDIKPDVLVKGGDWKTGEIIGADFVEANGGKVYSLPLKDGYSSSSIVNVIKRSGEAAENKSAAADVGHDAVDRSLDEHSSVFSVLAKDHKTSIRDCADLIYSTLKAGKKLLICGNGGSAADAQHLAAEFVGRYESERKGLPAIALTTDTSALTALANDYSFERVFARQVEALAAKDDLLIAISTSGNSPNVIAAVMAARDIGCKTLGMTGAKGKKLASLCDLTFMAPSERTARIQEAHITVAHIWCEIIDERFIDQ
ncbi:MAG: D-glycero-beta-D-manno-heptose 1-phosphate adenylyltransferase [Pyrinomonadaceae bacterium]|nr:D-glycero-beta-D-manno-heptose 1-phosphate adenylyltransferase [Pyrinomonadaceae bacterium]